MNSLSENFYPHLIPNFNISVRLQVFVMPEPPNQLESNVTNIRSIKVKEVAGLSNEGSSAERSDRAMSSVQEDFDSNSTNIAEENSFSYMSGLYAFVILGANAAWCSTYTLIPWHDVYVHPVYWWEKLINTGLILIFFRTTITIAREVYLVFKMDNIISLKFHLKFFLLASLGYIIPYCAIYWYWTIQSGMNHPMPYGEIPCFYSAMLITWATIWFHFPKDLRADAKFRKRLKNYLFYLICWNLIGIQEVMLDFIFLGLTTYGDEIGWELQWLMSLIIPMFRGLNEWMFPKFFNKAIGYKDGWTKLDEDVPATFSMEIQIADVYALYVAVRLGWARKLTVVCILVVEFLINFYYCVRIIQLHKKIGGTDDNESEQNKIWKAERESAIISLITVETIEVLIPLGYSMAYATQYYGPNATLFNGVETTYFGNEVQDIGSVFSFLFTMFAADTLGGVIISALLVWTCRINVIKEYCKILQKYWLLLLLYTSGDLLWV